MLEEKSCGAIVFLKTGSTIKYLLLDFAYRWNFAKGGMESNETEKQTVVRELKEETGIVDAHFMDGFRESLEYCYHRQGLAVHKVVVLYLMEAHGENVKLSFEHKGYIWLDYKQAREKLPFRNGRDTLDKAHLFLIKKGMAEDGLSS